MKQTSIYNLNKPEQQDFYNVDDFNHNADLIDSALSSVGAVPDSAYGVEVDFSTGMITRLGAAADLSPGADFDSIEPWHRRRCITTSGGVVLAYFGDEGYTESGFLEQDITVGDAAYPAGTPVQVMVEQPPFWFKVVPLSVSQTEQNGQYAFERVRYYVADKPLPGFELHPAFVNTKEPIYLSAFECGVVHVSTEDENGIELSDPEYTLDNGSALSETDTDKDYLVSAAGANVITTAGTDTTEYLGVDGLLALLGNMMPNTQDAEGQIRDDTLLG